MTIQNDAFRLLLSQSDDLPQDGNLLTLAVTEFDPKAPEPLLALLASPVTRVRQRGLYIFGELGRKGFVALGAALSAARQGGRAAKSHVLNGVLSYPELLNEKEVLELLPLCSCADDIVRERLIAILGAVDLKVIRNAVTSFNGHARSDHDAGLNLFLFHGTDVQEQFDKAVSGGGIWAIYALAALQRRARNGSLTDIPEYSGADYLATGVLANIVRIDQMAKRRTKPGTQT